MTEGTDALYDKALELSGNVSANFLKLGEAFAQLYNLDPEPVSTAGREIEFGPEKGLPSDRGQPGRSRRWRSGVTSWTRLVGRSSSSSSIT